MLNKIVMYLGQSHKRIFKIIGKESDNLYYGVVYGVIHNRSIIRDIRLLYRLEKDSIIPFTHRQEKILNKLYTNKTLESILLNNNSDEIYCPYTYLMNQNTFPEIFSANNDVYDISNIFEHDYDHDKYNNVIDLYLDELEKCIDNDIENLSFSLKGKRFYKVLNSFEMTDRCFSIPLDVFKVKSVRYEYNDVRIDIDSLRINEYGNSYIINESLNFENMDKAISYINNCKELLDDNVDMLNKNIIELLSGDK